MLWVNVLKPQFKSVGEGNNNRQTDIYTVAKKAQTYIVCSNQMGCKSNVVGVHVLYPKIMPIGEDNNRQTDRQTYSIQKGTNLYKE